MFLSKGLNHNCHPVAGFSFTSTWLFRLISNISVYPTNMLCFTRHSGLLFHLLLVDNLLVDLSVRVGDHEISIEQRSLSQNPTVLHPKVGHLGPHLLVKPESVLGVHETVLEDAATLVEPNPQQSTKVLYTWVLYWGWRSYWQYESISCLCKIFLTTFPPPVTTP